MYDTAFALSALSRLLSSLLSLSAASLPCISLRITNVMSCSGAAAPALTLSSANSFPLSLSVLLGSSHIKPVLSSPSHCRFVSVSHCSCAPSCLCRFLFLLLTSYYLASGSDDCLFPYDSLPFTSASQPPRLHPSCLSSATLSRRPPLLSPPHRSSRRVSATSVRHIL